LIAATAWRRLGRWFDPILDVWSAAKTQSVPIYAAGKLGAAGIGAFARTQRETVGTTLVGLRFVSRGGEFGEGGAESRVEIKDQGDTVILAGDVGGTKCNLALFSEKNGTLTSVFRKRFASKEFAQFELIVKEFSRLAAPHLKNDPVVAAGFWRGRAGDRQLRARNEPAVDGGCADTVRRVGCAKIVLLNDLGATGHSIEHLPAEEFLRVECRETGVRRTRALLAAGTGLGNRILVWDGARYPDCSIGRRAFGDFCAHTEQQIELLRFMRRRYIRRLGDAEMHFVGRGGSAASEFLAPDVKHANV